MAQKVHCAAASPCAAQLPPKACHFAAAFFEAGRFGMASAASGLRHPASASCLGRHSRLAGRCPNNSSLFPPLAAVVVVALWASIAERVFFICSSETPAGVSELLFHERACNVKRAAHPQCRCFRRKQALQMPFSLAASLVKMRHRAARRLPGVAQFKIIFPLNMPKATRRAFLIVPRSFPAQPEHHSAARRTKGAMALASPWRTME